MPQQTFLVKLGAKHVGPDGGERSHYEAKFVVVEGEPAPPALPPLSPPQIELPLKGILRVDSYDGVKTRVRGGVYDWDNLWLRRALVNGLAEPADDATRAMLGKKWFIDRYRVPMLIERARQAGISDEDIPAVAQGGTHGPA